MSRDEQPEWLESFLAVAERQSFSAAAERTHRSQSRVSSHVAALERSVGAVLFDRRHRPVRLTDAGQIYLPFAQQVVRTLSEGAEAITAMSQQVRGVVVVGSHPSASAGFLVPIITQMAETHPNVRIELTEATTTQLSEKLHAGALDLAIRNAWPLPPEAGLVHRPLWQEPFVALIPESHDLAASTAPLDPQKLAEYPLISIGLPGNQIEPEISRAAEKWNLTLGSSYPTQQPQTLMNMVSSGLGIGLINQLAATVSNTAGLVCRPVGHIEEGRTVSLWWDSKRHTSAATQTLFEAILNAPIPEGCQPATSDFS